MHAEQVSELREGFFESVVRHVRDVLTVVTPEGRVRFVSEATRQVIGSEPDEAVDTEAQDWVHPDDRDLMLERRAWLLGAPERTTTTVLRVRSASGWRHVETRGVNLVDDPHVQGLLYVTRDVEDRVQAEQSLVRALAAQRVVSELGLRALRAQEPDDLLLDALERTTSLLGATTTTLLLLDEHQQLRVRRQLGADPLPEGHPWPTGPQTHEGRTLAAGHPTLVEDLQDDPHVAATAEQAHRDLVSGVAVPLAGADGPLGVLAVHSSDPRRFGPVDVQFLEGVAHVLAGALLRTQRERAALERALHDPLTGLPTRSLLADRLEHALGRVRRGGGELALLLVDLDRFKAVNDALGHAAGDEVLRVLGARLAGCARSSDTVARHGGDEFVVLCEDDVTHVAVARVAAAIRRACAEPVALSSGQTVLLSCSVGTAWSIEVGPDADALLAAADASMYLDKRGGLAG